MGGHSSGGGLAIRFAGGGHAEAGVSSYLLLAPFIPRAPSVRGGDAGGWANLNFKRLFGLLALNAIGIHGFNGLPLIAFNKPVQFWDGTETLSYSYRLNVSYHPRSYYQGDVRALGAQTLVLVGGNDEAIDPDGLHAVFAADDPQAQVTTLAGSIISAFSPSRPRSKRPRIGCALCRPPTDSAAVARFDNRIARRSIPVPEHRGALMIIDCHGHYTTEPNDLKRFRQEQTEAAEQQDHAAAAQLAEDLRRRDPREPRTARSSSCSASAAPTSRSSRRAPPAWAITSATRA